MPDSHEDRTRSACANRLTGQSAGLAHGRLLSIVRMTGYMVLVSVLASPPKTSHAESPSDNQVNLLEFPRQIDLGCVYQGDKVEKTVPLINRATQKVELRNIETSCSSCLTAGVEERVLLPGATGLLKVRLHSESVSGPYHASVHMTLSAGTTAHAIIRVVGNIVPLFEVKPATITFTGITKLGHYEQDLDFRTRVPVYLEAQLPQNLKDVLEVQTLHPMHGPSERHRVKIRFTPATTGRLAGLVEVRALSVTGELKALERIPVQMEMPGVLTLSPRSVFIVCDGTPDNGRLVRVTGQDGGPLPSKNMVVDDHLIELAEKNVSENEMYLVIKPRRDVFFRGVKRTLLRIVPGDDYLPVVLPISLIRE